MHGVLHEDLVFLCCILSFELADRRNNSFHMLHYGSSSQLEISQIGLLICLVIIDSGTPPLPDTGQWLLLALNEKLPHAVVEILRARIIGLHHFLMLFMMLAFSVLFDSVKAPGLGLGARYMFTMAIGRLLRAITFVSTILPSARPWCATSRFRVPAYPHPWAQKYYVPYASDINTIREIIREDIAYGKYKVDIPALVGLLKIVPLDYLIFIILKTVLHP